MKKLKTVLSLLLLLLALAGCTNGSSSSTTALSVHFIDVGQGDSILIDYGKTEVLIDGGEKNSGAAEYIKNYVDGPLEVMIATHPDADHIGGLPEVLQKYDVKEVWYNGQTTTTRAFSDFMNAVNAENCIVHTAVRGEAIKAGQLILNVLNPDMPLTDNNNHNSIVNTMFFGKIGFLFTGDADKQAEATFLNLVPDVNILKVGHHGSRYSSSPEFLATAKPEIAVYSAGTGNSYGHPHTETIAALNNIGAKIYGTDTKGTITIKTDGNSYTVTTSK